jgi:hypothetical protein
MAISASFYTILDYFSPESPGPPKIEHFHFQKDSSLMSGSQMRLIEWSLEHIFARLELGVALVPIPLMA